MIFPIFVFALLPFCPESPRWLASRGASLKKVASVLALLEGKGATDTTPHILGLANEIVLVAQHEAELEESTTWHEVSILRWGYCVWTDNRLGIQWRRASKWPSFTAQWSCGGTAATGTNF